jgi:hypothetical protein
MNGGRKSNPGNSSLKNIYHLFWRIYLELSAHAARVKVVVIFFPPFFW